MLNEAEKLSASAEDWVVALFYQYCEIKNPSQSCQQQLNLCQDLNLLGRVRVSAEGINGTLGGSSSSIREYISAVEKILEFEAVRKPIHWKLGGFSKADLLSEYDKRLKTLSVKVSKEVVSLDLQEIATQEMIKAGPGKHLTPQEFHNILAASLKCSQLVETDERMSTRDRSSSNTENDSVGGGSFRGQMDSTHQGSYGGKELVVLDVRNHYETRIGRFQLRNDDRGILPTIVDPQTRQVQSSVLFSDFAKFVDKNVENFKGKEVLMYCTGGVRCERASAYMRSKGIDDVYQLSGGIHAYQEAFPEGGYFRGKNFVFDPRIAVPSIKNCDDIIGVCCMCSKLYDDYTKQCRCNKCRVLVLICDDCSILQSASITDLSDVKRSPETSSKNIFFCSQCNYEEP